MYHLKQTNLVYMGWVQAEMGAREREVATNTIEVNYQNWCNIVQESIWHQIGLKGMWNYSCLSFLFKVSGFPSLLWCAVWFSSFQLVKAAIGLLTLHWEGESDCDCLSDHTDASFLLLRDKEKDVSANIKFNISIYLQKNFPFLVFALKIIIFFHSFVCCEFSNQLFSGVKKTDAKDKDSHVATLFFLCLYYVPSNSVLALNFFYLLLQKSSVGSLSHAIPYLVVLIILMIVTTMGSSE